MSREEGCTCNSEMYDTTGEPIKCSKCGHQWPRRLNRSERRAMCPYQEHRDWHDPRPPGNHPEDFKCAKCGNDPFGNYVPGPMGMWFPPN